MELYVHIPFCVKKCDYCDFLSFPTGCSESTLINEYTEALCRELGYLSGSPDFVGMDTIFIGGGTPSLLSVEQMEKLLVCIERLRGGKTEQEYTIECNPGTLTEEKLLLYKHYGVNRLSIGLQTTDNTQLKALGRIHTLEQFLDNYRLARRLGFGNINVDLISAIPGQTAADWEHTLRMVAELKPEHISAYSLIVEPGTPLYSLYETSPASLRLPDEDTEREMYHLTTTVLEQYGYHRYEISNYAREGFECRHNLGYWTGSEYIACGLGASSYLSGSAYNRYRKLFPSLTADCSTMTAGESLRTASGGYVPEPFEFEAKEAFIRFSNTRELQEYGRILEGGKTVCIEELLDQGAQMAEFCILGLRLAGGIDVDRFEKKFACSFEDKYGAIVRKYLAAGFMKYVGGNVCLTESGFDVSNTIMTEFL